MFKFCNDHWQVVCLFVLMLLLGGAHGFMIHWNRAPAQIQWCENMISGTFTALVALLGAKSNQG